MATRIGGAQPQALADETKGHRVEDAFVLDMAVAVHRDGVPRTQIRSNGGKRTHQGTLDGETFERAFAGGAVNANAGLLHHPTRAGVNPAPA